MNVLYFAIPGDAQRRTGGYLYDARISAGLRRLGWHIEILSLPDTFPHPDAASLEYTEQQFAALPDGALVLVDGLAFGAMPHIAQRHQSRLCLLALVHHPLAFEGDLSETERQSLHASEREALRYVRHVIVTSRHTALQLERDYAIEPTRIDIVEPGVEVAPLAVGSGTPVPNLLCVASLTPRKNHLVLLQALAELKHLDWHLHCVGGLHHSGTHEAIQRALCTYELKERVSLHGECDDMALERHYYRADLLVLTSRYEGYGMVLTEAIARGLPIVATRVGAVPDTVPTGTGLLVEDNHPEALREALCAALPRDGERQQLTEAAHRARDHLVDWPERARQFADVLAQHSTWSRDLHSRHVANS